MPTPRWRAGLQVLALTGALTLAGVAQPAAAAGAQRLQLLGPGGSSGCETGDLFGNRSEVLGHVIVQQHGGAVAANIAGSGFGAPHHVGSAMVPVAR